MRNVMKKAHEITKKIIRKGDSYRETFRLALSLAHSLVKKGVNKMVELKGTEKQVKWANDLKRELIRRIEEKRNEQVSKMVGDRTKKSGKVLTEAERKEIKAKKFNIALEYIKSQNESEFFINNFKGIENWSNWDMGRNLENGYFGNTASELNDISSAWF